MLPEEHLWPIDSGWDFHAGGGAFKDIHVFRTALDERYGTPPPTSKNSRTKAQVMAMKASAPCSRRTGAISIASTGVIQWMLNNAWPSMIWHLYDWYMRPGGSYFGAKKGCEPLHIQYSYDDRSIVIVNSYSEAVSRPEGHGEGLQPRHE